MNARAWQKHQQNSHVEALKKQDKRAGYACGRANMENQRAWTRYEKTVRAAEIAFHEKAVREAIIASIALELHDANCAMLAISSEPHPVVKALIDATYQRLDQPERDFYEEYGVAPLPPARDYWKMSPEQIRATREMKRAGRAVIKAARLLEQQRVLLQSLMVSTRVALQKIMGLLGIKSLFACQKPQKLYLPLEQTPQASPNSPNTSI